MAGRVMKLAPRCLVLLLLPALGVLLPARAGAAHRQPMPLQQLPPDKVRGLAPLLRTSDLALLESDPKGELRQITTITLAAARPETVREVLIHPEHYGE